MLEDSNIKNLHVVDSEVAVVPVKFLDDLVQKIEVLQRSLRRKQTQLEKVISLRWQL